MKPERSRVRRAARAEAAERARGRAEERYETMSRANPVAMAVTTLEDDRVCEVNDAFLELAGWERDALVGRTLEELAWWGDPEDRKRIVEQLREGGSVRKVEATLRTRSGLQREVVVSAELLGSGEGARVLTYFYDVTERNRLRRKLEHLTLHDPLTGLPNRTLFRRRLAEVVDRSDRSGPAIGVLLLDLDRFKVVNDALGHGAGDELLRSVADRIRSCFTDPDLVARFGGDEFAVVIERTEETAIREAADRVARALSSPFEVAGIQVRLSTSIGIAATPPLAGRRPEDLVRFADIALQRARAIQGMSVEVFDPGQDTGATESLHRENELWTALARDEFVLLYQPIVSLVDERITGCEALIRWDHPERGLVAPDEFVPLAEESGLIFRMGTRVLERACADAALWGERIREGFVMSVNLSPRQFHEPDLVHNIATRVAGSALASGRLQLEITESAVMRTMGTVERLRDLGIRIAIDDFGTGFSSLQYLREVDVDVLKVDASFTHGIGINDRDEHIIRAIVRFAHGLGAEVVAEGIETPAQHAFLREVGCDFAQGYLYSAPVPAAYFHELLGGAGRLSQPE